MPPDVYEVGSDRKVISECGPVSHAETDVLFPAELDNRLCDPAFMPELKRMSGRVILEERQKYGQPFQIDLESGRKLPKHDLQLVF